VLVNPNLRGVTLGWNLQTTAQDELFAAIEGTAFHTRVILDRMSQNGVQIKRIIKLCLSCGGHLKTVEEAQDRICPTHTAYEPQASEKNVYADLYAVYSELYFAFGQAAEHDIGSVLPRLIQLSAARRS
jgi:L-ribulokinase